MKQETNDVVINVTTEWTQYKVNLNWDVSGDDMIRQFANIMRAMTYPTSGVIDSLRQIADELEIDMGINDIDNENLD